MAGGPVQAGSLYRVNETPLASEYFVPNVAGRVVRNNNPASEPMNMTVNVYNDGSADSTGNTAKAIELAKRMEMVARRVIATEKRSGGLLASP